MRADHGGVGLALQIKLPWFLEYSNLKADFQALTNMTNGKHSVAEMMRAKEKAGLSYIAIADHTKPLTMTHGSDERVLIKQMKVIEALNKSFGTSAFSRVLK